MKLQFYYCSNLVGMRIWFAGWGTGGHVFPIQSLIKYIDKEHHAKHEYFWFGERWSLEEKTAIALQNKVRWLKFIRITSGKWRREKELVALWKNIIGLFSLAWGICISLYLIWKWKVDVIFCKWGFVSLPVVIAGWIWRKPIILHESDTKPWLANRICSLFASSIFTWFEDVFPGKEIVVGQIIDDDLVAAYGGKPSESIAYVWDWDNTHFLVTGWSQWSQSIYEALVKVLETWLTNNCHFHVILGTQNKDMGKIFQMYDCVSVYEFVDQQTMGELLALCDVAITRGGTTSLAEQQLFGLKKIIIPIPWTHDQMKNGMYYKEHYWDVVIDQMKTDYQKVFEINISENIGFKKWPYSSPQAVITTTKETITKKLFAK